MGNCDRALEEAEASIPADPSIKNFSFANVDGKVYYRENPRMNRMELPAMTAERVLGMTEKRFDKWEENYYDYLHTEKVRKKRSTLKNPGRERPVGRKVS